jgi:glycosyltransferase involved in cell wall biosynthesis
MAPLHMTAAMVKADRAAGFSSRSVALHLRQTRYALVTDREFDAVFESHGAWFDAHWRALVDLLLRGDVWSAHYDSLFFPAGSRANDVAFRLIRLAGIRIIVSAHGGDVLHHDGVLTRFDWIERTQRDYPGWDLKAQAAIVHERMRLFDRHAAMVLPGDSTLRRFLRRNDLMFKYFPVDTEALRVHVQAGNHAIPVVVHAPNHRFTKGTDALLAAVARLQERGVACELRLVEGVPRTDALAIYATADIIADQFCGGAFGAFALEGLALGKPVLTYLDEEHLGDPRFNLPIVNTNPENIESVLSVLLQSPALRERLGRAGREGVERYQSVQAMAEVWRVIYEHVWWGRPLDLSQTAHFSAERQPRPLTEDPADPDFWPVPVTDLL